MRTTFDRAQGARWIATFIGFPLAGLAARAAAGPIDDVGAAALGGLVAGAVLGAVQALARRADRPGPVAWVAATAVGLAVGLTTGAAAVGYATTPGALVAMGAISGAGVGAAQAAVMRAPGAYRLAWATATPALWALGWAITARVIVDADRHHATFGASGAIVVAGLGALIVAVMPRSRSVPTVAPRPAPASV